MNLTLEERMLRDSYLVKRRLASYVFDAALIGLSITAFSIGMTKEEDGTALLFVGYSLPLISILRNLYYTLTYSPHIRSLIQKYEAELKNGKEAKTAPDQSSEPTSPSGRGAT